MNFALLAIRFNNWWMLICRFRKICIEMSWILVWRCKLKLRGILSKEDFRIFLYCLLHIMKIFRVWQVKDMMNFGIFLLQGKIGKMWTINISDSNRNKWSKGSKGSKILSNIAKIYFKIIKFISSPGRSLLLNKHSWHTWILN